ncbi:conserved hypothetical protein [Ricinus communis]|uniref:Uncharacterized protein n=1 Tax=Ricinus communis TaxID=3988 RepID=B9RKY4_RICCO|nr:conserved hypothetical protein [Ricinus communis]
MQRKQLKFITPPLVEPSSKWNAVCHKKFLLPLTIIQKSRLQRQRSVTRWDDDESVVDNQPCVEYNFMVGQIPTPSKCAMTTIILPTTFQKAEVEDVQNVEEQTQGAIHKDCKKSKAFCNRIIIQYPEVNGLKKVILTNYLKG